MSDHRYYKPRDFHFAQQLVVLRKRAHLTQKNLAARMGLSEKALRNWEGGSHYPSDANMRKLIEIYLYQDVFLPGHEQDEVHLLWDQLHACNLPRIASFDAQWFLALLEARQAQGSSLPRPSDLLLRGDWRKAIDVSSWYGRTEELAELEKWLLVDQCRLVTVLGMGGIGKTTLSVKLAELVAPHFDCVLWHSLHNAPSLEDVLHHWLAVLAEQDGRPIPPETDQALALLIGLLQERRCLLILDNLETVFLEGVPGGSYRQGYEGYATLIRFIAETTHRSCLLVASREKFPNPGVSTGEHSPVRVFRLGGLALTACQQLLQSKGLFGDQAAWSELVQRYSGTPLALKIVAETIYELFGGDIAAFLAEDFATFSGIHHLLDQQFERLSALEQDLIYWLAIERELVSLEMLRANLLHSASTSAVMEAMLSLHSRSLVERGAHGATFTLQPVMLAYITERLVEQMCAEIVEGKPALLLTHALLKGQVKDYLRTSQTHLLLQPVLDKLVSHFGSQECVEEHLDLLLQQLRTFLRAAQGYGGGNLVNLFIRLKGYVQGKDCSHLNIWQAVLQGAEAQDANFAGADLRGSVFLETLDAIASVAVSADGHALAAGGYNGEIRLWRVTDGQLLLAWVGHNRLVWSLAFDPEGSRLVSGGYDGLVKVWDVSTGQCVRILQGHTKWVRSLTIHPTGRLLATCSDDGSIRVWDLLADGSTSVWHQQESGIWSLAFSPDGKLLACGDVDSEIKLWDLESQQCLWCVTAHPRSGALNQCAIPSIAFSPHGEVLVSGGEDATIRVWQTSSGTHLSTLFGHTATVHSVSFQAEGVLASGSEDGSVKLWQVGLREEASRCLDTLYGHTHTRLSLVFGPNGLLVSGGLDGLIKIWQINREEKGGRCLKTLRGYSCMINNVVFSPDGRLLVSSEQNGTVRIWETASGRCLRILSRQGDGVFALAFSPDGRLLAIHLSGTLIHLWDIESERYLRTLQGHTHHIWSLAFSPDGRFLVSGSLDTTVKRWDVASGQCLGTLQGHRNWVWSVANSPDGQLLASGDTDGVVKVWEVGSGRCLHTLQGSPQAIVALLFTPDSQTLLSSNAQDLVTTWDVQHGQLLKVTPGIGDTYLPRSVTLSADGNLLAARSHDRTIKIWNVKRGEIVRTLPCHAGQPWSLAFSTDQRLLACGTDEGSIMLWEMQTGEHFMTLHGERPYERMNITGVTGITEAQKASLKSLGAIDEEECRSLENMSGHRYQPTELMSPVQAYRTLGIARQSLYERLQKGRLTPIYQQGNLRFLRSEIEAWGRQREQKGRVDIHEG